MSISPFEPGRATHSSSAIQPAIPPPPSRAAASKNLAPYVDLQRNPFTQNAEAAREGNPVADLIPDEVYSLLRANDMINDKAVRDYVIRRAFRKFREEQNIRSAEAIEKIKEIYPYLQMDTIRKIIYRITPGSGRKMMF